jgi:hypothetical protein
VVEQKYLDAGGAGRVSINTEAFEQVSSEFG